MEMPSARARASTSGCRVVNDAVQAERHGAIVAQLPDLLRWIPRPTDLLHPLAEFHFGKAPRSLKQLLEPYGDRLVYVRYRDDVQRKKRFTTVELLIAERDGEPPRPRVAPDQIAAPGRWMVGASAALG